MQTHPSKSSKKSHKKLCIQGVEQKEKQTQPTTTIGWLVGRLFYSKNPSTCHAK